MAPVYSPPTTLICLGRGLGCFCAALWPSFQAGRIVKGQEQTAPLMCEENTYIQYWRVAPVEIANRAQPAPCGVGEACEGPGETDPKRYPITGPVQLGRPTWRLTQRDYTALDRPVHPKVGSST